MTSYNNNLINKLSLSSKNMTSATGNISEEAITETMSDPRYLRQSSSLINDALQKGFDVLQLADGDIVMTGVKTVVYQYSWDGATGKLVRTSASSKKNAPTPAKATINLEELDDEELDEAAQSS